MGPQAEDYIETVLTCEGDFYDPEFHTQLLAFSEKLGELLLEDTNKNLILKKVEPWNSVKVTFNIPKEAAVRLKCLAEEGDDKLKKLGILAVQIEGDRKISLRIAGKNNETTELVFSTPDASIFDLNSSDDTPPPKNVENTSKNIAHYLGQQSVPQESCSSSVMDIINHVASGMSATSPSDLFDKPNVPSIAKPSHGLLPENFNLQAPAQISPKFPTPPPSISTPSSPGSKQSTSFSYQMQHSSPFGSQAAVNSMVSKLFGSKNASGTSPLLVNLLQNDAIAAAAAAAAMASGTLNAQTMNRLVGLPTPEGPPPKKKRKPRKPKDKDTKEVKKTTKSDKETESAIHNILNQAVAEGNVQDRVPPVGNEPISAVGRPVTPAQRTSPAAHSTETLSKSPLSHTRSPRHNPGVTPGQRQIINPSTGQLEMVDDDSVYFSPPVSEGGVVLHHKPPFRISHSSSASAPRPIHHNTQADIGVMSSMFNRTSPIIASDNGGTVNPHPRDSFTLSIKSTSLDQTVKPPTKGRKSPSTVPKITTHSNPHVVPKLNPNELVYTKPSYEASAQSNSAIMPVVSNIACSLGSHVQGKLSVSMQHQHFVNAQQIETSQQNQTLGNHALLQTTVTGLRTSTVDSVLTHLHQTTNPKTNENTTRPSPASFGQMGFSIAAPTASVHFPEQIISGHSVINPILSSSLAPSYTRDKNNSHTQGIHGKSTASNTPSQITTNLNSDISKRVESSDFEPDLLKQFEERPKSDGFERLKSLTMENHVDTVKVAGEKSSNLDVIVTSKPSKSPPNAGRTDISHNHCSDSLIHHSNMAHSSELSNNSCDDPTKHGSVDSGLGDIKENNGESPCGSSGNDSPGAAVSRSLTVTSSPTRDNKLSQISDKNVLTVGYVLNDGTPLTEQNKSVFTSKSGGERKCPLSLVSNPNSKVMAKLSCKIQDDIPELVKLGRTVDIKQANETLTERHGHTTQINQDHLTKSLNLIGRSDLNPGGELNTDNSVLLNGDDHMLHFPSPAKVVTSVGSRRVSPQETRIDYSAHDQSRDSRSSPIAAAPGQLSQLQPTAKPKPTEAHKGVRVSGALNVTKPSTLNRVSTSDPRSSGIICNKASGAILSATTSIGSVKINCSTLNSVSSSTSVAHTSIAISVATSLPVSNGSSSLSHSKSFEKPNLKPPVTVSAPVNPLLLHGHVMGNSLMLNTQVLTSKGTLPQTNGPVNIHALSSGSPYKAVSSTMVNASQFLDIPSLLSKSITSVSAAENSVKKDSSLVLKKRSKTPDTIYPPNKVGTDRSVIDIVKAVPSFAPPPSLTTVAPSMGHIPILSPLKTSPSSKMNTGMASLGPSPIMSTGLPYLNTPRQVTPPPPETIKAAAAHKGISIMKPLHDKDVCEGEDVSDSLVKDPSGKKSPKLVEKQDKFVASKRGQLTVQQILHDVEKSGKDALPVFQSSVISDGCDNLGQLPSAAKSATVALQQIAKQRDAHKEMKEHVSVSLSSGPTRTLSKLTSNEDMLFASSGIHMPNLVANQVNKIISPVVSQSSNMTITAPGFHKNLTESVQKVMKVVNPDECTVHQIPSTGMTVNDHVTESIEPRKSPIAKTRVNSSRRDTCREGFLRPQSNSPSGENLLIASAEAKLNIQDENKESVSSTNSLQTIATSNALKSDHVSVKNELLTTGGISVAVSNRDVTDQSNPSVSDVDISEHSYSSHKPNVKTEDLHRQSQTNLLVKTNDITEANGNNNDSGKKQAAPSVEVLVKDSRIPSLVSSVSKPKDLRSVSNTNSVSIAVVSAKPGHAQSGNIDKSSFIDQSKSVQAKKETGKVDDRNRENETNKSKESVGVMKSNNSGSNKVNDLKSQVALDKSDSKHSMKVPLTTTITTTKETSKTIVIKSDVKETTNFSLDLRSAVTASSSSKFIKLEPKDWRGVHTTKIGANLTVKTKTEVKSMESIKQESGQESSSAGISTRRQSASVETATLKQSEIIAEDQSEDVGDNTKESNAQKMRASSRRSSETPVNEIDGPKPARIKRRGSRGSNESKASSVDGGRIEESPPLKMNTRGRNKTTSESSENQDHVHSRRSSNASSRDRSTSPTVHNTRTGRQIRKKVLDMTQDPVEMKTEQTMTNEQSQTRATRSSKRKLPAAEDKETNNTEIKKSKIEPETTEQPVKVSTRGDSAEPDAKMKSATKPRASKSKAVQPPNETAPSVDPQLLLEDRGDDGGSSKRSTRSTRSQDHCELPNSYVKKKQKLS